MGTGKIKDNYKFYKGYEEEPEIRISTPDKKIEILHIWDGFFYVLFREPPLDGLGWHGFTRDFHQFEGVFSDDEFARITNLQEYLEDLKYYENKKFKYRSPYHEPGRYGCFHQRASHWLPHLRRFQLDRHPSVQPDVQDLPGRYRGCKEHRISPS